MYSREDIRFTFKNGMEIKAKSNCIKDGGKIDLIITKSISRFARNTVDTLTTVRKLIERGIEVFFEKENIHTLDGKGDARLRKKFAVDFPSKKVKANEGEVPQYYVENSHPAIIAPEVFDLVQYEWKRRRADSHWTSSAHPFCVKIFCGECGGQYGSKVWDSNTEYRRLIWQCNNKYKGGHCHTPHLTESEIKAAFLSAMGHK